MPEPFDYVEKIGSLTLKRKRKFYVLLAHNLTVSVRVIWSDGKLTDADKVEGIKCINEIMHRLIFRIEKLHKISKSEDDSWTEKDFYEIICHWTSQNYEILAGNIGWAIKSSYKKCL